MCTFTWTISFRAFSGQSLEQTIDELEILFAGMLTCLVVTSGAFAHALIDHADPKVGSNVKTSPKAVRIWFTEKLEPAFSSMRVLDADGKQVERRRSRRPKASNPSRGKFAFTQSWNLQGGMEGHCSGHSQDRGRFPIFKSFHGR
jgi:methionine-rich copper-binding protein CopC